MTHIESFLKQLEEEAVATRKMLSIVPTDKFDWAPHPKSMTIRHLTSHIAELPTWIGTTFTTSELDFADNPYQAVELKDTEELLAYFEKCLEDGLLHLKLGKEEQLKDPWTLRNGATVYSTRPKYDVLRMTMSQIIHHRAQLGVFLRLLDVKLPGSYGPTADQPF